MQKEDPKITRIIQFLNIQRKKVYHSKRFCNTPYQEQFERQTNKVQENF